MTNANKSAIILIDVQGKLAEIMYGKNDLLNNLKMLLKGAQLLDIPIIWTEQLPDKLGTTLLELSKLLNNQKPIIKSEFSCVKNKEFSNYIEKHKFDKFFLAGIETHVCVYQTAKDLLYLGYQVEIIADAVSSRTELNKQIGIEKIKSLGGKLTSVEMLLFEKQEIAQGDKFRELIKIIK